jgi:hypothetical protein
MKNIIYGLSVICAVLIPSACMGDALDRAAIEARQDQLQNVVLQCDEVRTYNIDPAVAAKAPSHFRQPQVDLVRKETSALTFTFLNGSARYDREVDDDTLRYWAGKGLPAISRQMQTVSATGRVEELTMQRLQDGRRAFFGGIRQLSEFSPDLTIDLAIGLRLLGGRQWLTHEDFAEMKELPSVDPAIIILRSTEADGHIHELHFDKRLLYALVSYRCTGSHGANIEISNSSFHRYGNVFIPGKIVRVSNIVDLTGRQRHPLGYILTVTHAVINDPANTEARNTISWPAHLQLFDARTNDRVAVGPTTRPMSDDDIRQQLAERRMQELTFKQIASERIRRALDEQPSTRP